MALAKITLMTELVRGRIVWLSAGSETELLHRPRDSGGGSTDRHYSTIHSVTQSYVTKAFHLQAHCGNPAILIAAARYPLQSFSPPWEFSTAPAAHIQHLHPPSAPLPPRVPTDPSSTNQSSEYSPYYVFHSHTVLSCVGSRAPLDFAPVSPMQTRRTGGCFQTLLHAANTTPKERLKCSRIQEMFFKHVICQMTLNAAKQWYGGSRWRIFCGISSKDQFKLRGYLYYNTYRQIIICVIC